MSAPASTPRIPNDQMTLPTPAAMTAIVATGMIAMKASTTSAPTPLSAFTE